MIFGGSGYKYTSLADKKDEMFLLLKKLGSNVLIFSKLILVFVCLLFLLSDQR